MSFQLPFSHDMDRVESVERKFSDCQPQSAPVPSVSTALLETSPATSCDMFGLNFYSLSRSSPLKRRNSRGSSSTRSLDLPISSTASLPMFSPLPSSSTSPVVARSQQTSAQNLNCTQVAPVSISGIASATDVALTPANAKATPTTTAPLLAPVSPPLPLLDLSTLSSFPSETCAPRTARASVDAITTSLSLLRPYLLVGSQASLSTGFPSCRTMRSSTPPVHVISFVTSTTPQLERHNVARRANSNGFPTSSSSFRHHSKQDLFNSTLHQQDNLNTVSFTAFPIRDDVRQKIDHVFMPVALAIDSARMAGECAALVCAQGISRSGACAIAYLMLSEGLSVDDALAAAREARPIIAPNAAFMSALTRLEKRQRHGRTTDAWSIIRPSLTPPPNSPPESPTQSHDLSAAFYGGERSQSCNPACNQLISFIAEDVQNDLMLQSTDVLLVERAQRAGVDVWCAQNAPVDKCSAAKRLAQRIAKQQTMDLKRFAGPAVSPGRLRVLIQGDDPSFDSEIALLQR